MRPQSPSGSKFATKHEIRYSNRQKPLVKEFYYEKISEEASFSKDKRLILLYLRRDYSEKTSKTKAGGRIDKRNGKIRIKDFVHKTQDGYF